jgi:tetratricopeptide (TPR) repeat protein
VTGTRAWLGALPALLRWTLLAAASALLLVLIGAGVWNWLGRREAAAQQQLGLVIVAAQRAVVSGQSADLDTAAKALGAFLSSQSGTRAGQQAQYLLGQVEYRRRQWDAAAAAFGEVARRDRGSLGALSRLGQGHAYEAKGDPARALEVYQQALGVIGPKDFLYGDLLLAKARTQEQTKDSTGAIASYKQYLKDLPSAERAQDVRIRLALLGSAG